MRLSIFVLFGFLVISLHALELAPVEINLNSELTQLFSRERPVLKQVDRDLAHGQNAMKISSDDAFFIDKVASLAFQASGDQAISFDAKFCPYTVPSCDPKARYRSYNGSCNNVWQPMFGAANTPFKRFLQPAYDDGKNSPRNRSVSGRPLPNPRVISLKLNSPTDNVRTEKKLSHFFTIFGQFLIHDLAHSAATTDPSGIEIDCFCGTKDSRCIPIFWPNNDKYLKQRCMKVTRSAAAFSDSKCSIKYREQSNLMSSYIDGTPVYGIDQKRALFLRTFSGGLMKTTDPITKDGTNQRVTSGHYLPNNNDTCSANNDKKYKCFLSGEGRTNENLALLSIHTLFLREHNRIAKILSKLNPQWNDETIYQETRKIGIAILQHITFNEYLNLIIGDNSLAPLTEKKYYNGYNPNINPAIYNEFTTAAFRFGHSNVMDIYKRFDSKNKEHKPLNFSEIEFKCEHAFDPKTEGLQSIFHGLLKDSSSRHGAFRYELQNRLVARTINNTFSAQDLLAFNIHRGRDHGLPPYIDFVNFCHNVKIRNFDDLKHLIPKQNIERLKAAYQHVGDIDLYAGGLMERKVSDDSATTLTFGCLIMKQFAELKNGDRFYYENGPIINPSAFSLNQLNEIKKVTISGVICNNYDLKEIQKSSFLNPSKTNPMIDCKKLKNQIDFSKWGRGV